MTTTDDQQPETTASRVAEVLWGTTELPEGVTIGVVFVDAADDDSDERKDPDGSEDFEDFDDAGLREDPDSGEHEVVKVGGTQLEVDYVCLTCGAQGTSDGHLSAQSWHDAL